MKRFRYGQTVCRIFLEEQCCKECGNFLDNIPNKWEVSPQRYTIDFIAEGPEGIRYRVKWGTSESGDLLFGTVVEAQHECNRRNIASGAGVTPIA